MECGTRQSVKMRNEKGTCLAQHKFTQFPNEVFLTQKKAIATNTVNSNVIQNVLVTDVPNTGNFSQVTDLGIWWAMAAEYHFQQTLPANAPNIGNLNPLNYIFSLSDYVNGVPHPPQINVGQGDRVRMQTHGIDPADVQGGHLFIVNGRMRRANPIINNINNNINNGQRVTPLYCYMGDNPMHRHLIPGIGQGPMLSPTMGSVSLWNNMNAIHNALRNAPNNTWSHIIDNGGGWIPINAVNQIAPFFRIYIENVTQNGVNSPLANQSLIQLLTTIYKEVDQPYNDFANYLIQQNLSSGQGQTLWQ